jgi:hypothetical protein
LTSDQLNDLVLDAVKLGHDLAKESDKKVSKTAGGWEAGRAQRAMVRVATIYIYIYIYIHMFVCMCCCMCTRVLVGIPGS